MLRQMTFYWFVYHLVLWHVMFCYRYLQYRGELLAGGLPLSFTELYSSFVSQHYSMLVCAVAVLPIVLWDMLKTTHRIAGPLVRFRNVIGQITRGEAVKKVGLRKGDMLGDFLVSFNSLIEYLSQESKTEAMPANSTVEPQVAEDDAKSRELESEIASRHDGAETGHECDDDDSQDVVLAGSDSASI